MAAGTNNPDYDVAVVGGGPNISELFELPASMRMYLYAGAIAGGIIPGTLSHPYPGDPSTCHEQGNRTE